MKKLLVFALCILTYIIIFGITIGIGDLIGFTPKTENVIINSVDDIVARYKTPEAVGKWIDDNITYMYDKERWKKDYWQSPEQTLKFRTGDCEDYAILYYVCMKKLNIPATVAIVKYLGKKNELLVHAFCLIDYDKETDTCIAYFDTQGYEAFNKRINMYEMYELFGGIRWKYIYILKKTNNNTYKYNKGGWKTLKKIRNKSIKKGKKFQL